MKATDILLALWVLFVICLQVAICGGIAYLLYLVVLALQKYIG